MTELMTTQPIGVASMLAALALLVNVTARGLQPVFLEIARFIGKCTELVGVAILAVVAWTKRTNDERDCAPKLADAMSKIATLRAELEKLRTDLGMGPAPISDPVHVVEEHMREPSGEQRLPAGMPPLPKRRERR